MSGAATRWPTTPRCGRYSEKVASLDEAGRDAVKALLRIGLLGLPGHLPGWGRDQLRDTDHVVTQIFASACSVAYSGNGSGLWKAFASLVLEASYEAALIASRAKRARPPGPVPRVQGVSSRPSAAASSATASRGSRAPSKKLWLRWTTPSTCASSRTRRRCRASFETLAAAPSPSRSRGSGRATRAPSAVRCASSPAAVRAARASQPRGRAAACWRRRPRRPTRRPPHRRQPIMSAPPPTDAAVV